MGNTNRAKNYAYLRQPAPHRSKIKPILLRECAEYLNVSIRVFIAALVNHDGPSPTADGVHGKYYDKQEIKEWLKKMYEKGVFTKPVN